MADTNLREKMKKDRRLERLVVISWSRERFRKQQFEAIRSRFLYLPFYLSFFYEGLYDDENTQDVFNVLATLEKIQIDSINQMLVFWWFWSLDRLEKEVSLTQDDITLGLHNIWSLDSKWVEELTQVLDNRFPDSPNALWEIIQDIAAKNMSSVFAFPHLRNAQVGMLRSPEFSVQRF